MSWIDPTQQLPPPGKKVIAWGLNQFGRARRIVCFHAPAGLVEADSDDDYNAAEYHDDYDMYTLKEGWYECNEFEEVHWKVEFEVLGWQPFPELPENIGA